jgi:hypothetical protein
MWFAQACANLYKGERRGLNPRMVAPQATALPLGYARHLNKIVKRGFERLAHTWVNHMLVKTTVVL